MTVNVQNGNVDAALALLKDKMRQDQIIQKYIEHFHPSQRGEKQGGRKK